MKWEDFISRQAAIDAVTTWINLFAVNRALYNSTSIQDILRQLPPAQPEVLAHGEGELSAQPDIIRCKDCKHLFEDNGCPLRTWWTHTEDDFCSYAERKDE